MKKKYIIECTEEQFEDLREVLEYVIDTEQDHFDEFLQEAPVEGEDIIHIFTKACNASRIEWKEVE